jgi:biotin operon repressor
MKHNMTKDNTLNEIKVELNKYRLLNNKVELKALKTSKDTALQTLDLEIEEYQESLEEQLISNIFDQDKTEPEDTEPEETKFVESTKNITNEPFISESQEKVIQESLADLNKPKPKLNDITILENEVLDLADIDLTDKKSRKDQVLHIIKQVNTTTRVISERLGISRRNVSSILTYLRQDGYTIDTNKTGSECLILFNHDIEKQETRTTVSKKSSVGRKQQLLDILKTGLTNMSSVCEKLDVSRKNVSSLLTYLRADGHIILTKRASGVTTINLISQE